MRQAQAVAERFGGHAALAALVSGQALRKVFAALDVAGEETRIVGGALRNALLERPVEEIDLATTLLPEAVMARAAAAGLRAIPTGIEHGTVTVLAVRETFEVTTLREDIATDGRHATVMFGRDFCADALRRDFTINALSMTLDGRLFDYAGGLDDIAARRVRFIGEPSRRIAEDYLRILRFFRFSGEFADGPLDPAGHLAAIRQRGGLARLSRERIRAELLKLLCTRRAPDVCAEMCADGLLHPLIASVPNPARLERLAALAPASSKDPLLRLAALCVHLPEDAERLRGRLRLSNAEARRLEGAARALISLHGRDEPPERNDLLALLVRHGRQAASDALILAHTDARPEHDGSWESARKFLAESPEPRLPFSGADIMARGIIRGRAIGEALKELQTRWIKAGFPQDPQSLARLLDETVREKARGTNGA
jgi:poly(A) polymerase